MELPEEQKKRTKLVMFKDIYPYEIQDRETVRYKQREEYAKDAEPFKVSGRCSVFCKSDCTHALNKGVRKSEVTSGLSLMMAEKVEDLLKKVKPGKVMVVGGSGSGGSGDSGGFSRISPNKLSLTLSVISDGRNNV